MTYKNNKPVDFTTLDCDEIISELDLSDFNVAKVTPIDVSGWDLSLFTPQPLKGLGGCNTLNLDTFEWRLDEIEDIRNPPLL